ncbi:inositol monophosphatase family protein [Corynebacterium capitovis]|uniref:inositol monophosphatase family protein n=1 Tax=Corynebacterium capitovis TaxID=131081 RepID=UPI00316AC60E
MTELQHFVEAHQRSDDAELAAALVRHAGALALQMRTTGLDTDIKTSISDVVTDADRTAEAFVASALAILRPDDGLLGEEGASRESRSGRTWVVDPVDGTYNFSRGLDYFCSALAYVEGEAVLIGAVNRPSTDTTWLAHRGVLTRDGQPVPPLADAPLSEVALATYLHPTSIRREHVRAAWQEVAQDAATVRMLGAGSLDLAAVATGELGGWLQHSVADWDWFPGKALVEAAGGEAIKVDAGGRTWCVAGNRLFVADVTARLGKHVSLR